MASLNDLVDLDRSALQQRLERHAEYEEDLGSLPEIMPDSLLEGTDVGSNGFTREDDAYESPMEDVGKENQTPVGGFNTARLIGKTEITPMPRRTVALKNLDSPKPSGDSPLQRSFIVPLNDQEQEPSDTSGSSSSYASKDLPISSTPMPLRGSMHRPRHASSSSPRPLASSIMSNTPSQGSMSTIKPAFSARRVSTLRHTTRPTEDAAQDRFVSSLSRRAAHQGTQESEYDDRSFSIATIQHAPKDLESDYNDSQELPEFDQSDLLDHEMSPADLPNLSSSSTSFTRGRWVDTRKRYSRVNNGRQESVEPLPIPDLPPTLAEQRDEVSQSKDRSLDLPVNDGDLDEQALSEIDRPASNRIPSLSQSSDAAEFSGSEASSFRAVDTPEVDNHPPTFPDTAQVHSTGTSATPSRDSRQMLLRRNVSLRDDISMTPGGLGVVQEENESFEAGSSAPGLQQQHAQDMTSASQFTTPGAARHLSRLESPRDFYSEMMQDEMSVEDSLPQLAMSTAKDLVDGSVTLDGPLGPHRHRMTSQSPSMDANASHGHIGSRGVEKSFMRDYVVTALEGSGRTPATARRNRQSMGSNARSGDRWSVGSQAMQETPRIRMQADASPRLDHSLAQSMRRGVLGSFHKQLVGMRAGSATPQGGLTIGNLSENEDGMSNQSFVSIASSADLTSDRRGTSSRFKGNTSLPGIGLDDIGSHAHEDRVQAAKIAKHLHHMNEQLTMENQRLTMEMNELKGLAEQRQWEKEADISRAGDQSMHQVQELQSQLQAQNQLARDYQEEIDTLKRELEETMADQRRREREADTATEDALSEKRSMNQQIQTLQWEKAAVEQEKERLRQVLESDDNEEKEKALQIQVEQLETRLRDIGEELGAKDKRIAELEDASNEAHRKWAEQQDQLTASQDRESDREQQLSDAQRRVADLDVEVKQLKDAQEQGRTERQKLIDDLDTYKEELEKCYKDLDDCEVALQEADEAQKEAAKTKQMSDSRINELESALASLDEEQQQAEKVAREKLSQLQTRCDDAESELAASRATAEAMRAQIQDHGSSPLTASSKSAKSAALSRSTESSGIIASLRTRLAQAQGEMEDLRAAQHQVNPAHKTMLEAKDARIEALEVEKKELQNALQMAASQVCDVDLTPKATNKRHVVAAQAATPGKRPVLLNKRLAHLNVPKTPLTPGVMPEFSFFNLSTSDVGLDDKSIKQRYQQIQSDLQDAHARFDKNFDRLEKANLVTIRMADRLATETQRVAEMERLVSEGKRKLDLVGERLERIKCPECEVRFNAVDIVEMDPSEISDATLRPHEHLDDRHKQQAEQLSSAIDSLRSQYEILQEQVAVDRQRMKEQDAEIRHLVNNTHSIETAASSALKEAEVAGERKLASLKRQMETIERENELWESKYENVHSSLKDTQVQVDKTRQQLKNAQVQLREAEADYKASEGQKRELKDECRRLTHLLDQKQKELERVTAKSVHSADLRKELKQVEDALNKHKQEANKFSQAVADLQAERDAQKSATQTQGASGGRSDNRAEQKIYDLEKQIEHLERQAAFISARPSSHTHHQAVADLTADRKKLTAQVRYLRAKFARENTFRDGLMLQKCYLLRLVGKFKQSEQETLALIASMGYPSKDHTSVARRSFKSVALAVRSIVRMRRAASSWSTEIAQRDHALRR